jgi:hypothetical protein
MQVEHSDRVVWVAPTAAVTASDIEKAQPQINSQQQGQVIAVVFTDAGATKMQDLTRAQRNKLIALVVDGRLIWAPLVRGEAGKESVLTGNGPQGLTPDGTELEKWDESAPPRQFSNTVPRGALSCYQTARSSAAFSGSF